MRLVLFQPDIPQNTGTILRLAACLSLGVDIIEPCGFVFSDHRLRRAGMDYMGKIDMQRYSSETVFLANHDELNKAKPIEAQQRLILLTTKAEQAYTDFAYASNDRLIFGRESGGVSQAMHQAADVRLTIPIDPEYRSLNVALAAAMVAGEARRQLNLRSHENGPHGA